MKKFYDRELEMQRLKELRALVRSLSKKEINEKGDRALELWEKEFKNYIPDFFDHIYSKIIS